MDKLEQTWTEVCKRLNVADTVTSKWWNIVQQKYSESQRHYHTLDHIRDMFRMFSQYKNQLSEPYLVSLAIYFHDIVYEPKCPDNEEKSVEMFESFADEAATMNVDNISKVKEWILMTKNHKVDGEGNEDYHYFLDIDMAVLGRQDEDYMKYAEQIRAEYIHVPEEVYRQKRAMVLEDFRQRPRLYATKEFHEKLGQQAKQNMGKEIEYLKAG